ncbi:MAG: ClpXP protease specificity-enhancing factor [Thiogranum sp.]
MTSNRPYLIRAINEWLLDNQLTPHLLVDAEAQGVEVPQNFIQDGKIVLNIGPHAVEGLRITNEEVTFLARFSGVSQLISFPVSAVLAIYARENGRGMMFNEGEDPEPDDSGPKPDARPSLKVVK